MGSITETPPFELRVVLELRDVVDRGKELGKMGGRVDVVLTRTASRDTSIPLCNASVVCSRSSPRILLSYVGHVAIRCAILAHFGIGPDRRRGTLQ